MRCLVALLIALSLIFVGCKKDKLDGDKSILIGEWEWVYTKKIVDYCDPEFMYTDTLYPITEHTSFQILFLKKGKVQFSEGGQEIESYRLIFSGFGDTSWDLPGYVSYAINLDGSTTIVLEGYIKEDSLIVIRDFPHPEGYYDITTSYFVRK